MHNNLFTQDEATLRELMATRDLNLLESAASIVEHRVAAILANPLGQTRKHSDPEKAYARGVISQDELNAEIGVNALLTRILEIDHPVTRRARQALSEAEITVEAATRAQGALRRCESQRVLSRLGLGGLNALSLDAVAALDVRDLVAASLAVAKAYPNATLRGAFFYASGKPASFDASWELLQARHGELLDRLAAWGLHGAVGGDSEEFSCTDRQLSELELDDVVALATDGVLGLARMSIRAQQDQHLGDQSRKVTLDSSSSEFVAQLARWTTDEPERDLDRMLDTSLDEESRALAAARLAGFLFAAVAENPLAEGDELALCSSELHLRIMACLPPALRIAIIRPGGPTQLGFRQLLSAGVKFSAAQRAASSQ